MLSDKRLENAYLMADGNVLVELLEVINYNVL